MPERNLLVLRHAKAEAKTGLQSDKERVLSDYGHQQAERIGQYLAEHKTSVDVILCSASVRTRQTLDGLIDAYPALATVQTHFLPELYLASEEVLSGALSAVSDLYQNVLVIGHNPDLHSWVLSMAQREACPDKLVSDYPTSALTHLQWHAPAWYPLPRYQANVLAFVTGKMLLADML